MPRPFARTAFILLAATAIATGCDQDALITNPPGGALPLPEGYWYLHTANDSAVSATIGERAVGVAFEQSILDSASLFVGDDGTWRQRYWYRVLLTQLLDRTEVVLDEGTWAPAPAGSPDNTYILTSALRPRTITVSFASPATELVSVEPMLTFVGAPAVNGRYRRTRP